METIEKCLGHTTRNCPGFRGDGPDCTPDEKNKECPYYEPITIHPFEVAAYQEQIRP